MKIMEAVIQDYREDGSEHAKVRRFNDVEVKLPTITGGVASGSGRCEGPRPGW
jgi:hypothetical protein